MIAKQKRNWILLYLVILCVGLVLTCTGCMSEEIRDENGTMKRYHQPMLGPEFIRLFLGIHLGSADPNKPAR
jgi:hypothetical protein